MGDTVLLRTMAYKSVFDFGKHEGRSVQQVLDLGHKRVLRWYYYNCSKISFLPQILEEIGITDEWRIAKPGKDPLKGQQLDELKEKNHNCFLNRLSEVDVKAACKEDKRQKAIQAKRSWARFRSFEREDRKDFSKGNMAWRNQGH